MLHLMWAPSCPRSLHRTRGDREQDVPEASRKLNGNGLELVANVMNLEFC